MAADDGVDVGPFVGAMDGAMVVVTAAASDDGERSGCLVGFTGQCSIDPPRLMTWISRVNHTFGVAARASHLAVHLVPDTDEGRHLAEHFGGLSGDEVDKFADVAATVGPGGVPLIDALPWRVLGEVVAVIDLDADPDDAANDDGGLDHVCFVLRGIDVTAPEQEAALFRLRAAEQITPGHPAD